MMNDEARNLGMADTRFANPSGLDAPGLYSTAWDLAMMGRVALDDPFMMRMSTTLSYKPQWDGPALKNGNALLKSYPGAFGLKIGFTDAAKETIVAAAERNGRQLVVSVLGSNDRYGTRRRCSTGPSPTRPAPARPTQSHKITVSDCLTSLCAAL